MVPKRVRGWTSGRSLPVLNFVKYPPGVDVVCFEGLTFQFSGLIRGGVRKGGGGGGAGLSIPHLGTWSTWMGVAQVET